jgi:hypothetical protein
VIVNGVRLYFDVEGCGPAARGRETSARTFGGDTSPEAARAWAAHALPLYGSASDGDIEF